jgi:hypothetical protein
MEEDKESVYIETTIPSYVSAWPSRDMIVVAHQIITRNFWDNERQKYDLYISQYVINECAKGDPEAARKRLDVIDGIKIIPEPKEVEKLAPIYKQLLNIPEGAKIDAFHLAISVLAEMDYVLSWNFKHMGVAAHGKLLRYNDAHGLKTPLLITPEAFLNNEEEE